MAYMNQEKKAAIAEALKKVLPKDWKYSLSVRNHSTIVFTLRSAPLDMLESSDRASYHQDVNHYYLERYFSGEALEMMLKIRAALNLNNYDNSDVQADYFDVGHYISMNIGAWNRPFVQTGEKRENAIL